MDMACLSAENKEKKTNLMDINIINIHDILSQVVPINLTNA